MSLALTLLGLVGAGVGITVVASRKSEPKQPPQRTASTLKWLKIRDIDWSFTLINPILPGGVVRILDMSEPSQGVIDWLQPLRGERLVLGGGQAGPIAGDLRDGSLYRANLIVTLIAKVPTLEKVKCFQFVMVEDEWLQAGACEFPMLSNTAYERCQRERIDTQFRPSLGFGDVDIRDTIELPCKSMKRFQVDPYYWPSEALERTGSKGKYRTVWKPRFEVQDHALWLVIDRRQWGGSWPEKTGGFTNEEFDRDRIAQHGELSITVTGELLEFREPPPSGTPRPGLVGGLNKLRQS